MPSLRHNLSQLWKIWTLCKTLPSRKQQSKPVSASIYPTLAAVIATSKSPGSLKKTIVTIDLNSHTVDALIDTRSIDSFICKRLVIDFHLKLIPTNSTVSMAESSVKVDVIGCVVVNI